MATDKTFTVAGVSKLNGDYKIRFANDVMRVKNLAKSGHEDIRLVELAESMNKIPAAKFIATLPEFADADAQTAIAEFLTKHDKAPKAKVEVKKAVKKAVASKPAKAVKAPKVAVPADAEDAPF
jgi:hypothetical protein